MLGMLVAISNIALEVVLVDEIIYTPMKDIQLESEKLKKE